MKLVRRQMFSHPKSGTAIRGSNTFKIKPFNATKRRVETKLFLKQSDIPGIRTIMKILIGCLAFVLTLYFDGITTTWLLTGSNGQIILFSPVVKLASYIIVATTIYRFLLDLLREFLDIVGDLWCLIYDVCYQKGLISVQRHKELVEQVLTFKDFQYQPNRKFHRGG